MRCATRRGGRLSRRRSRAARQARRAWCASCRSPSCARSISAAARRSRCSTRCSRSSGRCWSTSSSSRRHRGRRASRRRAGRRRSPTSWRATRSASARWCRRSIRCCSARFSRRARRGADRASCSRTISRGRYREAWAAPSVAPDGAASRVACSSTRARCARWHARGYAVNVWTVDDPAELRLLGAARRRRPDHEPAKASRAPCYSPSDVRAPAARLHRGHQRDAAGAPDRRRAGAQAPLPRGHRRRAPRRDLPRRGRDHHRPRSASRTCACAEDEGVSRRHARVTPVADGALLADLGSQNGTFVDGDKVSERVLKEGMKIRVGQTTVLKFARYDAVEEAAQRQLLESALRDGLTRAFNRRYFVERLGAEIRFAERHAQPLALLMLDLDHFKQLNDAHGHLIGDDVLRAVVGVLNDTLRAEDVLARYGGEEFAILVRGVNKENAQQPRRAAAPRSGRDGADQGGRREAARDRFHRHQHLPAREPRRRAVGAGRAEAHRAGRRGPLSCQERRTRPRRESSRALRAASARG